MMKFKRGKFYRFGDTMMVMYVGGKVDTLLWGVTLVGTVSSPDVFPVLQPVHADKTEGWSLISREEFSKTMYRNNEKLVESRRNQVREMINRYPSKFGFRPGQVVSNDECDKLLNDKEIRSKLEVLAAGV